MPDDFDAKRLTIDESYDLIIAALFALADMNTVGDNAQQERETTVLTLCNIVKDPAQVGLAIRRWRMRLYPAT